MTLLSRLQSISSHLQGKISTKPIISFIGGGNMTEAILAGLHSTGYPSSNLRYSEPSEERRVYMQSKYPDFSSTADNLIAAEGANIVILSVKPQVLKSVVTSMASLFNKDPSILLVSIAAGITTSDINKWINSKHPVSIVRCMPNTPALIGEGAVGLYATHTVNNEQRELTESIMKSIAKQIAWITDESQMDTVTAISGSGPAYFFLMMEAMENAAVEAGLSRDVAKALVMQTCLGAARMAQESQDDLATLRKKVTSPKGTTEAAIQSLESNQFKKIISDAVFAARDRGKELAEQLGKEA
ncbi:pyrroline-5-carboxylate reductase [Rhizopus microsporus ATCC 52813]|uniref:Pyrroline-5-carboxylate reductase n=2 Tax=Rhizopus microsporus TaxID=58291 RepID=A0A2G4SIC3_RHIZD|nr:pyrroline-5-carboxylate reductase [Rhizopus microsporus ATCC 52813]PHZ08523.1 pyrroline-5-carboxylate reductase [Rhizopus microsporus ATCC 52813]